MSVPLYTNETPLADPSGVSLADIAAGKASYDATQPIVPSADEKRLNVVDPTNGQTYSLPESQVESAIKQGFQIESDEQAGVRKFVGAHKGIAGDVQVAADKWADWATFGVTDAVVNSQLDDLARAKREALANDHEVASYLGAGAGFATSLLYGGEFLEGAGGAGRAVERGILGVAEETAEKKAVSTAIKEVGGKAVGNELAALAPQGAEAAAKAAGPGLVKQLAAKGAGSAVEGAILASPKAITEAALGDPEQAAETIVSGLGAGALFGIVGAGGKALLGKGASALKSIATGAAEEGEAGGASDWIAGKLRKFSDKEAIKSFNPLKKYSKKIDRVGEEEVAAVAKKYKLMPTFGETAEDVAQKVATKKADVGEAIGEIVQDASGKAPRVSASDVASTIEKAAESYETGEKALGASPIRKKLRELADDAVKAFPNDLSLEDLDSVRQYIGKNIPESEKSEGMRHAIGDVYHRLNDMWFERAEGAIKDAGGDATAMLDKLRALKSDYRALVPLADAAQDNIARGLANRAHSPTDYLGNIIGGVVGHAAGPGGAIVGAGVGGLLNKAGRMYGNTYLSRGAEAAAEWFDGKGAGLLGIEQAMKTAAERLDTLPTMLTDIAESGVVGKAERSSKKSGAASASMSEHFVDKPMSIDAFNKFATELANLHTDPAGMQEKLRELTDPIGNDAPTITAHVATKASTAVDFLYKSLPKPPDPKNPFANAPPWRPSDQQLQDFAKKVRIVADPFSVIGRLSDLTLSKTEVETMRTVYPKLWQVLVQKVAEHAASGAAKPLPYDYQVKLGLLTGQSIAGATSHVSDYQRVYQGPDHTEPQHPAGMKGGPPRRKPGTPKGGMLHLPSSGTETQRLALKT